MHDAHLHTIIRASPYRASPYHNPRMCHECRWLPGCCICFHAAPSGCTLMHTAALQLCPVQTQSFPPHVFMHLSLRGRPPNIHALFACMRACAFIVQVGGTLGARLVSGAGSGTPIQVDRSTKMEVKCQVWGHGQGGNAQCYTTHPSPWITISHHPANHSSQNNHAGLHSLSSVCVLLLVLCPR